MKINTFVIMSVLCVLAVSSCFSSNNKLAVTLGNPWVGVKYAVSAKVGSELRYAIDPDITNITARASYDFLSKDKLRGFAGLEYGMISFNYDGISGDGNSYAPFIGGELGLTDKLGVGLDFGYSTINLKAQDVSVSGPEYVFNLFLTYGIK